MKKIPTLFRRDFDHPQRTVVDEVTPGCEWVIAGEGVATRKWDGIAVLFKDKHFFVRYDAKAGRTPPTNFVPAQPDPDPETKHWPGWIPAAESTHIKLLYEALTDFHPIVDGTYELCGARIGTRGGANPENLKNHVLIPHGSDTIDDCPRTYAGLKEYFTANPVIEGVVFWRTSSYDCEKVKIKASDFGVTRRKYAVETA